ncbi:YaaL family protein [Psychrobacillus sp. INOP01]|uniref:YaaL family protein n=1 Tax=Psychrobacillus sp. INOP01 TaxID=2829187 RepID=UPI001BA9DF36|nr:YaaL family protein [Psychrobacillus sp. INOP01]QUG39878.1 YaaL family protein [Psychrobacillus sp. INOP01]
MMFSKKGKLKKEFDEQFVALMKETKKEWQQAQIIEDYLNDYDLDAVAKRKMAESIHFYLYKEARIRNVILK